MNLIDTQMSNLARPLVNVIQNLYAEPESEKGFQNGY